MVLFRTEKEGGGGRGEKGPGVYLLFLVLLSPFPGYFSLLLFLLLFHGVLHPAVSDLTARDSLPPVYGGRN